MKRIVHGTSLFGSRQLRAVMAQLGPGVLLPGLIYYVVSRRTGVLVALAVASSVPLLDAMIRLLRGSGFDIEDLVEIGAPSTASDAPHRMATVDWARRWPSEEAWVARKR